jgi:hypothetical protein
MTAPPRFLNSVYEAHPDDDSTKGVHLQAAGLTYGGVTGDRHVLLWWSNGRSPENGDSDLHVAQIIQLTGQAGGYSYYTPVAQARPPEAITANLQLSLGEFSRAQRDQILYLAKEIKFEKGSTTNGCQAWTRDLLEAMVEAGLIDQARLEYVDARVPLVKRRAED